MDKILIAGGTGFIGQGLIKSLSEKGYSLNILSRKAGINKANINFYHWDIEKELIDKNAFDGVSVIINLTGANIGESRWTKDRKKEIINSRLKSIALLFKNVEAQALPIQSFISSSAVGYYGAVTTGEVFTETSKSGTDFLASVCKEWEDAARQFESLGTSVVILRKGVVIGEDGGMYQKLKPLAMKGINTALGSGKQYLPWIDITDMVAIYNFFLDNKSLDGVYNAVASQHITMKEFSTTLLKTFHKPNYLPNVPAFLLKMLYGEMAIMLLEGSKVSNEKLKNSGFQFAYDTIQESLLRYHREDRRA